MTEPAGGYIEVVGFKELQHYKDRNPPWIKLYGKMLDNYAIGALADCYKWHLVGLWILASRYENRIPNDLEWIAKKLNTTEPMNLQVLADAGLIVLARRKQDASKPQAKRSPRRDRDREEKKQPERRDEPTRTPVAIAGDLWKARRGEPSYPRIGKALKPLLAARGAKQVLTVWEGYLLDREGKSFATPEDFAQNYELYRKKWGQVMGQDGCTWEPMPDEPEAAA